MSISCARGQAFKFHKISSTSREEDQDKFQDEILRTLGGNTWNQKGSCLERPGRTWGSMKRKSNLSAGHDFFWS